MEDIVRHIVAPVVSHPEAISIQSITTERGLVVELAVHPDDKARIADDREKTLRAIRTIVSAAAGRERATVELVDEHGAGAEE
jgi:predicted RNA-binding protein YlqC (UPF0109 family)